MPKTENLSSSYSILYHDFFQRNIWFDFENYKATFWIQTSEWTVHREQNLIERPLELLLVNCKGCRQQSGLFPVLNIDGVFFRANSELPDVSHEYSTKVCEKGHKSDFFSQKMTSGNSEFAFLLRCGEHICPDRRKLNRKSIPGQKVTKNTQESWTAILWFRQIHIVFILNRILDLCRVMRMVFYFMKKIGFFTR